MFQGMEFRVDGKTREKLERLAAALPRCGLLVVVVVVVVDVDVVGVSRRCLLLLLAVVIDVLISCCCCCCCCFCCHSRHCSSCCCGCRLYLFPAAGAKHLLRTSTSCRRSALSDPREARGLQQPYRMSLDRDSMQERIPLVPLYELVQVRKQIVISPTNAVCTIYSNVTYFGIILTAMNSGRG